MRLIFGVIAVGMMLPVVAFAQSAGDTCQSVPAVPAACFDGDVTSVQHAKSSGAACVTADQLKPVCDALKLASCDIGAVQTFVHDYFDDPNATCAIADGKYGQCTEKALKNYFAKNPVQCKKDETKKSDAPTKPSDAAPQKFLTSMPLTVIPQENYDFGGGSANPCANLPQKFKNGTFEIYDVMCYITYLTEFAIYAAGLIAVFFVVIGGYKYMTGVISDDKEGGKNTIKYALAGLAVTIVAWTVINAWQVFVTSGETTPDQIPKKTGVALRDPKMPIRYDAPVHTSTRERAEGDSRGNLPAVDPNILGAEGSNFTKQWEGFDECAKPDLGGRGGIVIGHGKNFDPNGDTEFARKYAELGSRFCITEQQASELFVADYPQYCAIASRAFATQRLAFATMPAPIRTAGCDMAYQTGKFDFNRTLALIARKQCESVAAEFENSKLWRDALAARDRSRDRQSGLLARAEAQKQLLVNGCYEYAGGQSGGTLTHADAMSQLGSSFTVSSTDNCTTRTEGCTSLEGVKPSVISGLKSLQQLCGSSVPSYVITGGTEEGHAAGQQSHGTGYKADLRRTDTRGYQYFNELNACITQNGTPIAARRSDRAEQYQIGSAIYANEGDHWDILFPST